MSRLAFTKIAAFLASATIAQNAMAQAQDIGVIKEGGEAMLGVLEGDLGTIIVALALCWAAFMIFGRGSHWGFPIGVVVLCMVISNATPLATQLKALFS